MLEVKTVRSAGGTLAEAYEAARSGFKIIRAGYSDEVILQGYAGPKHLKAATASVLKQAVKYVNIFNLSHIVVTDGVTYELVIKHPTQAMIFLAPPINSTGLITPTPGPVLCTYMPLGLSVALCALEQPAQLLSPSQMDCTVDLATVPDRRVSLLLKHAFAQALGLNKQNAKQGTSKSLTKRNTGVGLITWSKARFNSARKTRVQGRPSSVGIITAWDQTELDHLEAKALHSFQGGLLLGRSYHPCRHGCKLPELSGPFVPSKTWVSATSQPFARAFSSPRTPVSSSISTVSNGPVVVLQKYLSSGRLWDVFLAEQHTNERQLTSTDILLEADGVRRGVRREDTLYNAALKNLQGRTVGIWYGLFGGLSGSAKYGDDSEGIETWIAIMEYAGKALPVEELSESQKQKVVQAYEGLHAAGVIHVDVDPRHWLWRTDGSVMLIDFEGARDLGSALKRGNFTPEDVQNFYDDEMDHVVGLLRD